MIRVCIPAFIYENRDGAPVRRDFLIDFNVETGSPDQAIAEADKAIQAAYEISKRDT